MIRFFKMAPLIKPVATEAKKLEIVPKSDFKTLFEYAVASREGAWKRHGIRNLDDVYDRHAYVRVFIFNLRGLRW